MASVKKADARDGGVLGTFWDVVVVGSGYSGFVAAMAAAAAGKRALLVSTGCDLLWESSLARNPVAGKLPPEIQPFMRAIERVTGIAEDWIDPGAAEWVADELLAKAGVARLCFATPVAADITGQGLAQAVTFALEDRLAAIGAAQWIDATEDGLLARACGLEFEAPAPLKRIYRFYLQRDRWPLKFPFDIFTGIYGAYGQMEDSCWSAEKIFRLEIGNAFKGEPFDVFEPFLAAMRKRLSAKCPDALLSHWSWVPYPLFPRQTATVAAPCQNLALAVPMLSPAPIETIGDRCALGAAACARILNSRRTAKKPPAPPKPMAPKATRSLAADVCVVGVGTGGLMATVASSRGGAKTLALEAAQTIGGMAGMGGVRSYHLGCQGGLQDEFDAEVKRLSPNCASPKQVRNAYHGLSRQIATDIFLRKSKAAVVTSARPIPGTVKWQGGRIASLLATTPTGIAEVTAKSWIDAAGCPALAPPPPAPAKTSGKAAKAAPQPAPAASGPLPPWSQMADFIGFDKGGELTVTQDVGRDGAVDASSSLDLTRARLEAMRGLVSRTCVRTSNSFNRTLGIAPEMGVRRRVAATARYRLGLDDMVERRHFNDAVGFTAGRVGELAKDAAGASRDLDFFVGACGLAGAALACDIPYRALIAEGADNLWLAFAGAGATPEAAFAFRKMRDVQRVGEAAGSAAAIAAKLGVPSAEVPHQRLKAALLLSGALKTWRPKPDPFASAIPEGADADPALTGPATAANVRKWVAAIGGKNGGLALWRLYRLGKAALPKEVAKLAAGKTPKAEAAQALLKALG